VVQEPLRKSQHELEVLDLRAAGAGSVEATDSDPGAAAPLDQGGRDEGSTLLGYVCDHRTVRLQASVCAAPRDRDDDGAVPVVAGNRAITKVISVHRPDQGRHGALLGAGGGYQAGAGEGVGVKGEGVV